MVGVVNKPRPQVLIDPDKPSDCLQGWVANRPRFYGLTYLRPIELHMVFVVLTTLGRESYSGLVLAQRICGPIA